MQGTAADIIKRAMVDVDQWLRDSGAPARMILQVHDELVFEAETGFIEELRSNVVQHMSQAAQLRVPLVVDTGTGSNWDEARIESHSGREKRREFVHLYDVSDSNMNVSLRGCLLKSVGPLHEPLVFGVLL